MKSNFFVQGLGFKLQILTVIVSLSRLCLKEFVGRITRETLRWMISLLRMASAHHLKSVHLKMLTCVDGPMKRGIYHNTSCVEVSKHSSKMNQIIIFINYKNLIFFVGFIIIVLMSLIGHARVGLHPVRELALNLTTPLEQQRATTCTLKPPFPEGQETKPSC